MTKRETSLWIGERVLMAVGFSLLGVFAVALVHRLLFARAALQEFEDRTPAATAGPRRAGVVENQESYFDFATWSAKRIAEFRKSLLSSAEPAVAVLIIDKLNLRIPVFAGTDEWR